MARRNNASCTFLEMVFEGLIGENIVGISADHYRKTELRQGLKDSGLNYPLNFCQMINREAGENIRYFQRVVISGKLKCRPSLLLTTAVRNSALVPDRLGNEWLDRQKATGRIDPVAASVLAVGPAEARREPQEETKRGVLLGIA